MPHRDTVTNSPSKGMLILYHRVDGMWLIKILEVSEYVYYKYKHYKGGLGKPKEEITVEELAENLKSYEWKGGSHNTLDNWRSFMHYCDEYEVLRVNVLGEQVAPRWEL